MSSLLQSLLFPPRCAGCDRLIPVADWRRGAQCFCPDCRAAWERAKLTPCPRCGEAQLDCRCMPPALRAAGMDTLLALSAYGVPCEDGRRAAGDAMLLRIKDRHIAPYEQFIAAQLTYGVRAALAAYSGDAPIVITYCPRRTAAVRQSGTDQARRIAQALARQLGLPCRPLLRHVGQREQKRLGSAARAAQARRAYRLHPRAQVSAIRIVLVDDIVTTGASMAACCEALLAAGALSVMGVAAARTAQQR